MRELFGFTIGNASSEADNKANHKNKQKKDPKGHRNAEVQSTTKYTQRPLGKLAVLLCGPAKQQHPCISQYYHTTTTEQPVVVACCGHIALLSMKTFKCVLWVQPQAHPAMQEATYDAYPGTQNHDSSSDLLFFALK
jgi:hypothetical protein